MNPPKIESLNHVAIEVQDLNKALHFYREIVGLRELTCPPDAISKGIRWFELPEGRMLHLIENLNVKPTERAHFALTVSDVSAWRAHLALCGNELIEPKVNLYDAERVFVRDPSGNLLEFVRWL